MTVVPSLTFDPYTNPGTPRGGSPTGVYNVVTQFRAVGDGVTDDTAAIQAAIDACSAALGGIVFLPKGIYLVTGLMLKSGVKLTSLAPHMGYGGGGSTYNATILCTTPGATVIDTPVGNTFTPTVSGLTIYGFGVASIGIRFRSPQWGAVKDCHILSFTDEGLKVDGGNAGTFRDLMVMDCLRTRARAGVSGAVEIGGADHHVENIEATSGGVSGMSSASMYCQAIVISQTNGFHYGLIGEISDGGIYVTGSYNRFVGSRSDLCYGHGWFITGNNNSFSACHGVGCGSAALNTYDHFKVTGIGNSFSACRSKHTTGNTVKYGFEDTVTQAPVSSRNSYDETCGGDGATAPFIAATYAGSGRSFPPHDIHPANGTTQIDVTGTSLVVPDLYAAPATVTDFIGGVQGQTIRLYGVGNVTIQHAAGGNIRTNTAANKTLASLRFYRFTFYNSVWYEDA